MVPALMGLTLVFLLFFIFMGNRAHTEVKLGGGRATIVRGDPPGGMIRDLKDVARQTKAEGSVVIKGAADTLAVSTRGLDDRTAQRVRNVVIGYRNQIRP